MSARKRSLAVALVGLLSVLTASAVPTPSAAVGSADLVKPLPSWPRRTLRGVAYLDNDVSKATVSIFTRSGRLLYSKQDATAEDGSFEITYPLPSSFKIVITDGSLEGAPFSHDLERFIPAFEESAYYKVNAITTLMARYQDRHPELAFSEVTERVKAFLSIPPDVDISDVIYSSEWFCYHFSHYFFMRDADANGGITDFIDRLLDEMDSGGLRSFRDAASAGSSVFQDLLKSLLEGAVSEVGGAGAGWILGLLNLGGGGDTDARLQEMEQKIDEVVSDLANITVALAELSKHLDLNMTKVEQYVVGGNAESAISAIKTHYDQTGPNTLNYFASLRSADINPTVKKNLQTFVDNVNGSWDIQNQLTRIHDAIISDIGGTEGLLELWTRELTLKSPVGDDQLMQYYKTLEGYFSVLLVYQFKGANLLVETWNYSSPPGSSGDSAATKYLKGTFQPMIKEETEMFLKCVMKLIVYNGDLYSQYGFLPGAAQDIMARATFFVAQTLNEEHFGLRVGVFGTANMVHDLGGSFANDPKGNLLLGGQGVFVDLDLPDKAYDAWGTLRNQDLGRVTRGTVYTLDKYDFGLGHPTPISPGTYKVFTDGGAGCQATVRTYTKDFIEDTKGEILYGYCLGGLRTGGKEAMMDSSTFPPWFHRNQWAVKTTGNLDHSEADLLTDSLYLKSSASNKWYNDPTDISVKLEYTHNFTFGGAQSTTAYLNLDGTATGSVYIHHVDEWTDTCAIGVNIGIFNVTQNKVTAQFTPSKSPSDIDATEQWNQSLQHQLSFQLDPGNQYTVFANVVTSGHNYSGNYRYLLEMTLSHLSLSFTDKPK